MRVPAVARWAVPVIGCGAAALLACLMWGVAVGPRRLQVEEHEVCVPNLPGCWEGEVVALVSDVQVGMPLGNESVAADAIQRVVQRKPAAVLLAGDFILHTDGDAAARIDTALEVLRPLGAAGLQVFAVLGNHDYQLPDDVHRQPPLEVRIETALRRIGVTVLRNEAALVPPRRGGARAGPLYVVGLGEHRMQDDRVRAALAPVPDDAPRIVLMHNPDTFPRLPAGAAPFAVAGHTHGAQVSFLPGAAPPWWMRIARMPADLRRGAGWIDRAFGRPGNRLYISRGIGFSTLPVRINAVPELTFFTLRGSRAAAPRADSGRSSFAPTARSLDPGDRPASPG